jgi:hypothetical protein
MRALLFYFDDLIIEPPNVEVHSYDSKYTVIPLKYTLTKIHSDYVFKKLDSGLLVVEYLDCKVCSKSAIIFRFIYKSFKTFTGI